MKIEESVAYLNREDVLKKEGICSINPGYKTVCAVRVLLEGYEAQKKQLDAAISLIQSIASVLIRAKEAVWGGYTSVMTATEECNADTVPLFIALDTLLDSDAGTVVSEACKTRGPRGGEGSK